MSAAHTPEDAQALAEYQSIRVCANAHKLVEALREIIAMSDEDTGTFRKRGGTYRGLTAQIARAALTAAGVTP